MLALAWPLVLTNLSQVALATTDVIMMGWLGPRTLAAGALGANLNFAFQIFGIGLVTATAPLLAIELGRRRHAVREVRRTVRQGFWAAITFVIPVWAILWNAEPILLMLGQEPDLARGAASYLHTYQWSILPFLFYVVLRNFVSALERPRAALIIAILAILVNAVLVWVLMFGKFGMPAMGLPGAGLGTTLANVFMFVGLSVIVVTDRRFRRYHLFGRFWRADWPRYREIMRIGIPISFTIGFEVTIFNAAAFLMGIIGATSLAAHSIANQIVSVAFMVPLGLGNAATVRVGLMHGAGDVAGVARAGWTAYGIALIYAFFAALIMLLFPRAIIGAYLDLDVPANMPVVDLAVTLLILGGIYQLADAGQAVGSGMLRGLGDTRVPMIYAALGYWGIGMTLSVALGFWAGWQGVGIWIGLAVGLTVVWALMTIRWARREKLGLTRRSTLGERPLIIPAAH